jgi:hypothetical protein
MDIQEGSPNQSSMGISRRQRDASSLAGPLSTSGNGDPFGSLSLNNSVQNSASLDGHRVISPFSQSQWENTPPTQDQEISPASRSPTFVDQKKLNIKTSPPSPKRMDKHVLHSRTPKKKRIGRTMSVLKTWSSTIDITTDIIDIIEHCLEGGANCILRTETENLDAHLYLLTYFSDFLIDYFHLRLYSKSNAIDILWTLFRVSHEMTPLELYTKVINFNSDQNLIIEYVFGRRVFDDKVFSKRVNPTVDSLGPVSLMRTITTLGYSDKVPPYNFADNKWKDPYYRIGFYTNSGTKEEINERYGFISGMKFSSQDIVDELVSYRNRMVLNKKKGRTPINKTNRQLSKILEYTGAYNSQIIINMYKTVSSEQVITEGEWIFDMPLLISEGIYQISNGEDEINMLDYDLTGRRINGVNVAVKLILGNAWRIIDALIATTDSLVDAVNILSKLTVDLINYDYSLPFLFEDEYFTNTSLMDPVEDLVYGFLISRSSE